jgi:hypothetical protein
MRFAQWVFRFAGIYGMLVIPPMYFLEDRISLEHPPAVTHPEFFYGFIGVTMAWQIAFLIIGQDPVRHRPLMLAGIVEKFTFFVAAWWLFAKGRIEATIVGFACFDMVLGMLFFASWIKTRDDEKRRFAR